MTDAEILPTHAPSRAWRLALAAVLLIGVGLRAQHVWRPLDGSIHDAWREPDMAAMARNFDREGMNILYPRIDWRGDGPGYTEAELPVQSWCAAAIYRVLGPRDEWLRVISFGLSLAALAAFTSLATYALSPRAALAAVAVFAVNRLGVRMATSIHPEALMFAGYVAAAYWFWKWTDLGQRRHYWLALAATVIAILGKVPAAHIGLFFAPLCLTKFGWQAVRRWDVWLFAIVALGVPAAWYIHAQGLWREYGNSLGMSNEAYARIGTLHFLRALQETLPGLVKTEVMQVWTPLGAVLGAAGLWFACRERSLRPIAFWAAALAVYFFVSSRTTGEAWAIHYHIVTVPAAALLIGVGFDRLLRGAPRVEAIPGLAPEEVIVGLVGVVAMAAFLIHRDGQQQRFAHFHQAAVAFRDQIDEGALIITSGGPRIDKYGMPHAYNKPYMFYWTDRRGFTLADEDCNLDHVAGLQRRGARYLILETPAPDDDPEKDAAHAKFFAALQTAHRLVATEPAATLFRLGHNDK